MRPFQDLCAKYRCFNPFGVAEVLARPQIALPPRSMFEKHFITGISIF